MKSYTRIAQQIKTYALEKCGVDKVGIASIDRFNSSPEGFHPTDFLPGCKSVIVFAIRLPDGAVQSTFRAFEDQLYHVHGVYGAFGYVGAPNYRLLFSSYKISKMVERLTGETATPQTAGPTHGEKLMSMRHCAVAAGLGEFGWNSIVLTPEFGPRNRFGAVLTTAELPPDPLYHGPRLCNPAKCHVCEKMCPTGAIPPYKKGQERHCYMGDKDFIYSAINWTNCRMSCHGMRKELNQTGGDMFDMERRDAKMFELLPAMLHYEEYPNNNFIQHSPTWKCGNCLTYCPVGSWKERFYDTGLSKIDITRYIDQEGEENR